MKTLKFAKELVSLVLSGEKTLCGRSTSAFSMKVKQRYDKIYS